MTTRLIGLSLILAGLGLRILCLRELKKVGIETWLDLSVAAPPAHWTSKGPYSWPWPLPLLLRHPMYCGSLAIVAGVGMLGLGWGGATIAFAAYPHFFRRAVLEEVLRGHGVIS